MRRRVRSCTSCLASRALRWAVFCTHSVWGDTFHPEMNDIVSANDELHQKLRTAGYVPDTTWASRDASTPDQTKGQLLCEHSERLALVYGLLQHAPPRQACPTSTRASHLDTRAPPRPPRPPRHACPASTRVPRFDARSPPRREHPASTRVPSLDTRAPAGPTSTRASHIDMRASPRHARPTSIRERPPQHACSTTSLAILVPHILSPFDYAHTSRAHELLSPILSPFISPTTLFR